MKLQQQESDQSPDIKQVSEHLSKSIHVKPRKKRVNDNEIQNKQLLLIALRDQVPSIEWLNDNNMPSRPQIENINKMIFELAP